MARGGSGLASMAELVRRRERRTRVLRSVMEMDDSNVAIDPGPSGTHSCDVHNDTRRGNHSCDIHNNVAREGGEL